MQSSEIRIGDRVYRYKRPTLGLLKKYGHLETFVTRPESFGEMLKSEDGYQKFVGEWPAFLSDVLDNPDEEVGLEKILPLDVVGLIAGFFVYGANAMSVNLIFPDSVTTKANELPRDTQSSSSSIPSAKEISPKPAG